jgi:hypothetical protein
MVVYSARMGTEVVTAEPLRQGNLFTGEWVTVGQKKTPLQQLDLFPIGQTFRFGERVRPYLANAPRPTLELISEDPRTEEEMEQDRLKQAQALTVDLFAPTSPAAAEPTAVRVAQPPAKLGLVSPSPDEPSALLDEDEADEEVSPPADPPLTKYAAYRELVRLAEERAMTTALSPVSALAETISMSAAKFQAQYAGLTSSEIAAALQIGEFRGKQQVEARSRQSLSASDTTGDTAQPRDWDIPVLWTSRADLLKRRPDLAEAIKALSEYEVEAMAALVGEALQEFYWIQLNVVLSLYLDHDLRLHLNVTKGKRE